jgi:[ribosomal protein S5]-alanine N-acetyltransferase
METPRTFLKKTTETDFDLFFSLYGNEEVMKTVNGKPYSYKEAVSRFRIVLEINKNHPGTGYFGVFLKDTKEGIGMAKIVKTQKDEAEIGYVFHPDYWGKGFGNEISEALVTYSRTISWIKRLVAIIDPENVASRKILLKCGFKLEKACTIDDLPAEVYFLSTLRSLKRKK